jgi:hypothetical protein
MQVVLSRASSKDVDRLNSLKTGQLSRGPGRLNELNTVRSLASLGFKLHGFSSTVHLSELVYVFLRL